MYRLIVTTTDGFNLSLSHLYTESQKKTIEQFIYDSLGLAAVKVEFVSIKNVKES